jgi:hypothetical protein
MATATVQDYRRTDQRANVLENPFWLTSAIIDGAAVASLADKACVLFSFPKAGQVITVWDVALQVITGFTATTTFNVGVYTLATDAVTTAGTATLVDVDYIMPDADLTSTAAAWYYPATSAWLTARAAGTHVSNQNNFVGAATTVPCIAVTLGTAVVIIGKAQLHLLVSIVPGT